MEEENKLVEERRHHDPATAMATAVHKTMRPTIVASLGAAIAYGSLAATSFRGFADFEAALPKCSTVILSDYGKGGLAHIARQAHRFEVELAHLLAAAARRREALVGREGDGAATRGTFGAGRLQKFPRFLLPGLAGLGLPGGGELGGFRLFPQTLKLQPPALE